MSPYYLDGSPVDPADLPESRPLPLPAPMLLRMPGIRHVRYLWHSWRLSVWVDRWMTAGVGIHANEYDLRVLEGIRQGEL